MPFTPSTIERLFKVLGDENRLRILQALEEDFGGGLERIQSRRSVRSSPGC